MARGLSPHAGQLIKRKWRRKHLQMPWIIDSWPWKSFLLLGFNLQHVTVSHQQMGLKAWPLDPCCRLKAFPREREWSRSRNPSRSSDHTSFHLFSFFSWERIMKENNKWKRSCETIVMRAKRCLLFFFEALDLMVISLMLKRFRKEKRMTSSMLRSFLFSYFLLLVGLVFYYIL